MGELSTSVEAGDAKVGDTITLVYHNDEPERTALPERLDAFPWKVGGLGILGLVLTGCGWLISKKRDDAPRAF